MKKKIKNRTTKYNLKENVFPLLKGVQGDFMASIIFPNSRTVQSEKHTPNPSQEGNVPNPIRFTLQIIVFLCVLCGSTIQAQTLNTFLQKATENNTELKALQLEYEAEVKRADQQVQLQNPTIGIGVPILRPETRLGAQVLIVSASQMFPWFGSLKAKKEVVLQMSKAKYERISATKLNLFYKIKTAYYQLVFLDKKTEIISNFIKIYNSIENVSLAKIESGQSSSADVLRTHLKLQELNQELLFIQNAKRKYEIIINELTKQELETTIEIDNNLETKNLLEFDLVNYKNQIENHHPLLVKLDKEMDISIQKQALNKKQGLTSFGLGLDYSLVSKRTDANPDFNGNDILIPKLSVSIPIYRKAYKAKNEEENLLQDAIKFEKESTVDAILSLLMQYKLDYDNALLQKQLTEKQIKTNDMVYEVLLSKYSSKGNGFDELLLTQNIIVALELKLEESKLKERIALAGISLLTEY